MNENYLNYTSIYLTENAREVTSGKSMFSSRVSTYAEGFLERKGQLSLQI